MLAKSPQAYRTITEAAAELEEPQHVLRFWEQRFKQVRPMKRAGNRRYYSAEQMDVLRQIQKLLRVDLYTIAGAVRVMDRRDKPACPVCGSGDWSCGH